MAKLQKYRHTTNVELEKCKIEIDKNEEKIFNSIMESSIWAGIGIAVGVCSGGLLKPVVLAHLVRLARDIRNDWATYLETRNSLKTTSAFFLLNVFDKKSQMVKTDIPGELPAKMTTDWNRLKKSVPLMEGMPIVREEYPQGKKDDVSLH